MSGVMDTGLGGEGDQPDGITIDDLPTIMRALFDQCVADARAAVEPHTDFNGFVERLWQEVATAFSLVRRDWPSGVSKPWPADVDEQRGFAEALLEGRVNLDDLPS